MERFKPERRSEFRSFKHNSFFPRIKPLHKSQNLFNKRIFRYLNSAYKA